MLPGPTAVATAYVASGCTDAAFYFGGFFPRKDAARAALLAQLKPLDCALVFYESPNRLASALGSIAQTLPLREVAVCRELTKLHEEVFRGPASEVQAEYAGRDVVKGEIVIVIDGPNDAERTALLTISAGSTGDNTYAIEVNQSGKPLITLSLNTSELPAFTAAGGTQKVKVTCNGAWSASVPSSIDWLHISPTSGIGDAEISVKCDAYTGIQDRLSVLTVTAGSKNPQRGSVVITQSY